MRIFKKRFSTWQIELTTRCPLRCTMCAKEADPGFPKRDMAMEDFRRILPYLKEVENVVLEGWGESVLHPRFVDCIGLIKKEGVRAGFVTCGMGMTPALADSIAAAGIDFIGFSLSGATAETHNRIRLHSDFETIVKTIALFGDSGTADRRRGPKRHIVYLLLHDNIGEVPLLVELAYQWQVPDVVLLNLIQVSSEEQDRAKVFVCHGENPYPDIIKEAKSRARKLKINLMAPNLSPSYTAVCSENPLSNLYISVNGDVSPCVFLCPPVGSPFKRIFCGREDMMESVHFGNIFRDSFAHIWNDKGYVAFREAFLLREKKQDAAYRAFLDHRRLPPETPVEPPEPCRTCHKILGL